MTWSEKVFVLLQHVLPQHLLSRCIGRIAASRQNWIRRPFIRTFIRIYDVDMSEAADPDPDHYDCFNDFFTRALRPGVRESVTVAAGIASPADGAISQLGEIRDTRVYQAKGQSFGLVDLLGGDAGRAAPFRNGVFATIYLSPRDYHRVHMPFTGELREMVYIPGRLFSVNETTAKGVPDLFARNERMVAIFDTAAGPMAVIMVGAMIVAGIETTWAGRIAPASGKVQVTRYGPDTPRVQLQTGDELGRFFLGSTAIVLFGPQCARWETEWRANSAIRLGQLLGHATVS